MNHESSDQELLESLKKGCQDSFKILYSRHFQKLFSYAMALVKEQQIAEDVLQELFIGLWEKREVLMIENLGAYLKMALRNKIINIYKRNRYVDLDDAVIASFSSPDGVEDRLVENDLEKEFNIILDKLPQRCRNVFYLSRIKMYKNTEIAEELNISIRTVETHISNALQHFKIT
ncbi:RNA polymerase sigma-70 factor, ECF subfamily [Flagellimonas taeanensis]|jgi:RNA polymerase sigma-70 factor (ECF subfamily)|uniref:RNA polymerase sigma-70 factor, ECF subfamily n=1 Tax=Flagellimonas taeanensis TaxID=1005926 RepID=A0A1M6UJ71_9FLAO|nr:RNA polymerase sigma-70 factor [Allomuricauda taeanensis]SFC55631.1 RNA polymerase sigma-70 factor, ECF subfamily [Allomuricauda taeanensis]SHK69284.1 RNA polymerase sigma-70 factor, ECF subfamily [Allomuricauda taeanensis]